MEKTRTLLNAHQMAKTPCRVEMLETLMGSESALTEFEIRQKMAYDYDRATVFRNLRAFLKEGLIHAVALEGGELRYQISETTSSSHVHFHCKSCSSVYCLKDEGLRDIQLPVGFIADDYDLVIKGYCKSCEQEEGPDAVNGS